MNTVYYIGLDIHKKSISFVIKTHAGQLIQRGSVEATRPALTEWANQINRSSGTGLKLVRQLNRSSGTGLKLVRQLGP